VEADPMTVAVITLALVIAAAVGLLGWMVHRTVTDADRRADSRVAQVATEAHLEQSEFQLKVTTKALDAAKRRATALEEALGHAIAQPFPDADVAPDDHRTRVRRLAEAWRSADEDRDALLAESGEPVSLDPATAAPSSDAVVPDDPDGLELP